MSDFIDVADAKARDGLRIAFTEGVPSPWGEAVKGMLYVKGIDYARVRHVVGDENAELVAWTGINSAPIAIYNDEPPRGHWSQMILLAEQLAPTPPLIPADETQRALMFGLIHEIAGDDGYGWNRRLLFFDRARTALKAAPPATAKLQGEVMARLAAKYDYGGDGDRAKRRIIDIFKLLDAQLTAQASAGHRFFMGDALTAVDIYWACFCSLVKPLPLDQCPVSEEMHGSYHETDPDILAAATPVLMQHRDYIYQNYLELPMVV